MLTKEDYCDYDTCVALKELGYPLTSKEVLYEDKAIFVPGVLLYSAQKWLREEKNIIVDVRYGAQYYNVVLNHRITCGHHIVKDKNNRIADFIKYEEALSEGIKCTVKILKENETIHR